MSRQLLFWDVDTQFDFMNSAGALYVPQAEQIEPNLAQLTRAAGDLSIPVIADADDHEVWDSEISFDPDFQVTFPPHCMRDTPGAERIAATRLDWTLELAHDRCPLEEIRRNLDTGWPRVLILKKKLDVFSNPNTETVLETLAPRQVVVYGVALDFCVRCVVDGLLERGQAGIVVLTDATRAIYPERAEQLLRRWRVAGVQLMTTDELLGRIDRPARVAVG